MSLIFLFSYSFFDLSISQPIDIYFAVKLLISSTILSVAMISIVYFTTLVHFKELVTNKDSSYLLNASVSKRKRPNNELAKILETQLEDQRKLQTILDTQKMLEERLQVMSSFAKNNPDPILRLDKEGNILVANPAAYNTFSEGEAIVLNWDQLFTQTPFLEIYQEVKGKKLLAKEIAYRDRLFLFQMVYFPDIDIVNIYSIDVTEKKKLEEKMFHTSRLAQNAELATGVAHEINNPLTILIGHLDMLEYELSENHLSNEGTVNILGVINNSAKRIQRIVGSLRKLSQSRKNHNDKIEMDDLLIEIADNFKSDDRYQDICFELNLNSNNKMIQGCRPDIEQVINSLIENAIDAVADANQPKITLESEDHGHWLEIKVIDNGSGIEEGVINKIFDSFFTTKPVNEAVGLGLSISHSIVSSLQGHILVNSKSGRGSEFKVRIPKFEESGFVSKNSA